MKIRCGVCERVCPADNVKVADTVTIGSRCEVCFACVHNCPQGAIHLKNEKSAVRFRNENVSLIRFKRQVVPNLKAQIYFNAHGIRNRHADSRSFAHEEII